MIINFSNDTTKITSKRNLVFIFNHNGITEFDRKSVHKSPFKGLKGRKNFLPLGDFMGRRNIWQIKDKIFGVKTNEIKLSMKGLPNLLLPAFDFLAHVGFAGFLVNGHLKNGILGFTPMKILLQVICVVLLETSGVSFQTLIDGNHKLCDWMSGVTEYRLPFGNALILVVEFAVFLAATRGYILGYKSVKNLIAQQRKNKSSSKEILEELSRLRAKTESAIASRRKTPTLNLKRPAAPIGNLYIATVEPIQRATDVPKINLIDAPTKVPIPPPPPPTVWPVKDPYKTPVTKSTTVTNSKKDLVVKRVPEDRRIEMVKFLQEKPTEQVSSSAPNVKKLVSLFEKKNLFADRNNEQRFTYSTSN